MNLKYSVGLDVSSKKINACFSVIDEKQKVIVKSSTIIANTLKRICNFRRLDCSLILKDSLIYIIFSNFRKHLACAYNPIQNKNLCYRCEDT